MGSYEFINNIKRYCFWLFNKAPNEFISNPFIKQRLEDVSQDRKKSATKSVREMSETPYLFTQIRQPNSDYLAFPAMSSSARKYIPIGYVSKDIIASNQLYIIPDASLYLFGIMTSNVHMAWMKTVCGRLKSDYRYAPAIYNNFPFPIKPTDQQKEKIEKTAQAILDARANYPDSSLADLYDPLLMPADLRKAHKANDRAVMEAYGMWGKVHSESECVAWLFQMYEELTSDKKI